MRRRHRLGVSCKAAWRSRSAFRTSARSRSNEGPAAAFVAAAASCLFLVLHILHIRCTLTSSATSNSSANTMTCRVQRQWDRRVRTWPVEKRTKIHQGEEVAECTAPVQGHNERHVVPWVGMPTTPILTGGTGPVNGTPSRAVSTSASTNKRTGTGGSTAVNTRPLTAADGFVNFTKLLQAVLMGFSGRGILLGSW
ncbi:hypothetical protein C8F04DRAFT_1257372 [Mycena alexandri]|uniref:Uncharacterized protein n=1 Tax=Mycena alexandri TaxID=1745969 RepID=A0AAD6T108_9AGAR|nr:hypothetical protein C8F04DRAFT_1257372 [Mycena alexandri]